MSERRRIAEAVREACVQAALDGYDRAVWGGLCHEGVLESIADAVRDLELDGIIEELPGIENRRRQSK